MNEIKIDSSRDYYAELGVDRNSTGLEILQKFFDLSEQIKNDDSLSYSEKFALQKKLLEAMKVLTNDETRAKYDELMNFEDIELEDEEFYEDDEEVVEEDEEVVEEEAKKAVKVPKTIFVDHEDPVVVEEVEEDEETAKKGNSFVGKYQYILSALVLGGAILIAGNNIAKKVTDSNKVENTSEAQAEEYDDIVMIGDQPVSKKLIEQQEIEAQQIIDEREAAQEAKNTKAEEVAEEEVVEEEAVEVNSKITDEEAINQIANSFYNKIKGYNASYTEEDIKNLVKYARHDSEEIQKIINSEDISAADKQKWLPYTNVYAYDILFDLAMKGADISEVYQDLDSYENIKQLNNAYLNINQYNNTYQDEVDAYAATDKALQNMDYEDYAEVVGVRAILDAYSPVDSYIMARGGGLTNINTPDYWLDHNGDGNITYEENAEGPEYEAELRKTADISGKCKVIYDNFTYDNPSCEINRAVEKAREEDNILVKKLKK